MGWEIFAIIYLSPRKRYDKVHSYHGTLMGSRRYPIDPCGFRWPWVTLKKAGRGRTFLENFRNYAPPIWPRTTKFAVVMLVGEGQYRGPILPSGSTTYVRTVWATSTKFGMVARGEGRVSRDQTRSNSKGSGNSPKNGELLHTPTQSDKQQAN